LKNLRELGLSIFIIKKEAAKLEGQGGRKARTSPFCVLVSLKDRYSQRINTMRDQNPMVEKSNQHFLIYEYGSKPGYILP
jgi:hypothetical protein